MMKRAKELGSGNYGHVFLTHDTFNQPIAVKSVVIGSGEEFAIKALHKEAKILQFLAGAPNVVHCIGEDTSVENNVITYNLLLEYARFGSLSDLIRKDGPIPEFKVACYASMLLKALEEIHSRGIIHCDLKSDNILVFNGVGEVIKHLKIADFGISRILSSDGLTNKIPSWEGFGKKYYNVGSPSYASPESVVNGYHGPCVDVWSIGCIVYEMIYGKPIWEWNGDMSYLYDQVLNYPIQFPGKISKDAAHFLKSCLNRDCNCRRSVKDLLKHQFIVKNLKIMSKTYNVDNLMVLNQQPKQPFFSRIGLFSDTIIQPAPYSYDIYPQQPMTYLYSQALKQPNQQPMPYLNYQVLKAPNQKQPNQHSVPYLHNQVLKEPNQKPNQQPIQQPMPHLYSQVLKHPQQPMKSTIPAVCYVNNTIGGSYQPQHLQRRV